MEDYSFDLEKFPRSFSSRLSVFFSKNFDGEVRKLKKLFDFILPNIPSVHFYVSLKDDIIYGALVLLNRVIWYNGVEFDCCGLSFMAKEKEISNKLIVKKLIKKVLDESEKSTISIGFASKKMDNFWYRYGFIGIDNFSEFIIPIKKITVLENKEIKIIKFHEKNLDDIIKIYNKTHKNIGLSFDRSKDEWNYILKKNKEQFEFRIITLGHRIAAFFVYKKNEIFEVSYDCESKILKKLIFNHFYDLNYSKISFKLSLNHPFIEFLKGNDYSLFTRKVMRGGHIFRINNVKTFCFKIREKLESELINLNIIEYNFHFKGLNFIFKDSTLQLHFQNNFEETDVIRREFAKLFFGFQDLKGIDKLLFNSKNVSFSKLDHF